MSDRERTALLSSSSRSRSSSGSGSLAGASSQWSRWRRQAQGYLASQQKHYLVLALVALDVLAILAEILVSLIACDSGAAREPWAAAVEAVAKTAGLVFSSLFLVELAASVWAFGWGFFNTWFHCFDAFVILASFVVDVLAHGVVEEIASLVIVLRLWRMVKIVEEVSVGASEQMEELEAQVEKLQQEKEELQARVQALEARGTGMVF